jgi:homoserine dehydrogenase
VPKDRFEWIEEWHASEDRKYLVGLVHVKDLQGSTWWRENNISLILMPDAIVENLELHLIKKRSLELAGLQMHHGFKTW